ncbi:hypothetical protein BpHYR1_002154 [Brachionus plicatilis]|uniref:Uncharacterized protein n=1 Tax=Brachionus plicatilis TaxID=10195 RepID=A0A3M7P7U8_BRAPC|nr:hypothetical protein BpHYR1_002154 [Brachionus plicatilis]
MYIVWSKTALECECLCEELTILERIFERRFVQSSQTIYNSVPFFVHKTYVVIKLELPVLTGEGKNFFKT